MARRKRDHEFFVCEYVRAKRRIAPRVLRRKERHLCDAVAQERDAAGADVFL